MVAHYRTTLPLLKSGSTLIRTKVRILTHQSCALEVFLRQVIVLTLLIVNSNNVPASSYDAVFKSAGLDGVSFTPQSSPLPAASWPTLGEMIDSGKRLVTFLSTSADPAIPYLIDGELFFGSSWCWHWSNLIILWLKSSLTFGKLHSMSSIPICSIAAWTGLEGTPPPSCISSITFWISYSLVNPFLTSTSYPLQTLLVDLDHLALMFKRALTPIHVRPTSCLSMCVFCIRGALAW